MLKEVKIKYKDRRVTWSLHKEEMAVVRCGACEQEANFIQGVRQCRSLSSVLLNGYFQKGMHDKRKILEVRGYVKVQGEGIDMLRYANNICVGGSFG